MMETHILSFEPLFCSESFSWFITNLENLFVFLTFPLVEESIKLKIFFQKFTFSWFLDVFIFQVDNVSSLFIVYLQ